MNNRLRRIIKYIQHLLIARHSWGFNVHSPFIYHFTKFVIYEKNPYYFFPLIEGVRRKVKADNRVIQVVDFGMGRSGERKVKDIARKSLTKAKYGQLLFRIANVCNCNLILELGTSLGITTSYLAAAAKKSTCVSMEGCPAIAVIAQENFNALNLDNVHVVVGDINNTLPALLEQTKKIDLIFIDANHNQKAVLNYFEQCLPHVHSETILVVDDIYWSKDMECAWKHIKEHDEVTSTIDLFQLGIVFFNPQLHKKEYKMRF